MWGRTRGNGIRWRWQTTNSISKGNSTGVWSFGPSFGGWPSRASYWDWCCIAPEGSDPLWNWLWGCWDWMDRDSDPGTRRFDWMIWPSQRRLPVGRWVPRFLGLLCNRSWCGTTARRASNRCCGCGLRRLRPRLLLWAYVSIICIPLFCAWVLCP